MTEFELRDLVKQIEERYKYSLSLCNISSCSCIMKLCDVTKFHPLPIPPNLLPDGLKSFVDDIGDFIRYNETFLQQRAGLSARSG